MKKSRLVWFGVFVSVAILFLATTSIFRGQTTPDLVQSLEDRLAARHELTARWDRDAMVVLAMVLGVGVMGIVIGYLQRYEKRSIRIATGILAILVSIVTLVQTTLFPNDHRVLQAASRQGEHWLEQAENRLILARNARNPEEWGLLVEEFEEYIEKVDGMDRKLLSGSAAVDTLTEEIGDEASLRGGFSAGSLVFAAEPRKRPPWVTAVPESPNSIYFVGRGRNPSIRTAKEFSLSDVRDQASMYFDYVGEKEANRAEGERGDLARESLARKLAESGEIVSSYYEYDEASGAYIYYTLMRVDRSLIPRKVEFFGLATRRPPSKREIITYQSAKGPSDTYFARRNEIYSGIMEDAQANLSQAGYERFIKGRTLRRSGDPASALPLLELVVEESPEFYMGQFNLALDLDALGRTEDATQAYRRALSLAEEQQITDSSIYNTYGYFLLQHGGADEAIPYLEKALEIDPENPLARRNLMAARKAALAESSTASP